MNEKYLTKNITGHGYAMYGVLGNLTVPAEEFDVLGSLFLGRKLITSGRCRWRVLRVGNRIEGKLTGFRIEESDAILEAFHNSQNTDLQFNSEDNSDIVIEAGHIAITHIEGLLVSFPPESKAVTLSAEWLYVAYPRVAKNKKCQMELGLINFSLKHRQHENEKILELDLPNHLHVELLSSDSFETKRRTAWEDRTYQVTGKLVISSEDGFEVSEAKDLGEFIDDVIEPILVALDLGEEDYHAIPWGAVYNTSSGRELRLLLHRAVKTFPPLTCYAHFTPNHIKPFVETCVRTLLSTEGLSSDVKSSLGVSKDLHLSSSMAIHVHDQFLLEFMALECIVLAHSRAEATATDGWTHRLMPDGQFKKKSAKVKEELRKQILEPEMRATIKSLERYIQVSPLEMMCEKATELNRAPEKYVILNWIEKLGIEKMAGSSITQESVQELCSIRNSIAHGSLPDMKVVIPNLQRLNDLYAQLMFRTLGWFDDPHLVMSDTDSLTLD